MAVEPVNTQVGTGSFDEFVIAGYEVLTDNFKLASGQSVVKNQVLAQDANGKLIAYDEQAASPANVAKFVAKEEVDATTGDKPIVAYVKCVGRKSKVVFGNTGSYEGAAYDDLRMRGIILHGTP